MTPQIDANPAASDQDGGEFFVLMDCEVETLRRAALARSLPFDEGRRRYTQAELVNYGLVREGYTRDELRAHGFGPGEVSCFDETCKAAEVLLRVETPFGSGIRKWQLPFDMMPIRIMKTVFPPNSKVSSHVHPAGSPENPGGGLRIVTKGRIFYKGHEYCPGDWFYVPNGVSYGFTTDPLAETECFYKYAFFAWDQGNRFSHPHATDEAVVPKAQE